MTYSELKSNIADWLNRSDLTSVIPTFISLAENRLNRQLRVALVLSDLGFLGAVPLARSQPSSSSLVYQVRAA